MTLPIYAYGQPVLRQAGLPINADYPNLKGLIQDMWDTMYQSKGVGLAAPQIGLSIQLFVMDTIQIEERKANSEKGIKRVFINARKIKETGEVWSYEEGCLSIPDIRGDVDRPERITIQYMDENFVEHTETFDGMNARVIQHEYDHTQGILFTDLLKPLKKRLVKNRLEKIRTGQIDVSYRMKFVQR